jgi:hypothetical protein
VGDGAWLKLLASFDSPGYEKMMVMRTRSRGKWFKLIGNPGEIIVN